MHKIAIKIQNLNKTYENGFRALQDIQMEVYAGEIFALLGPNGAGKTTLIGSICGTVIPTSGKIQVMGYDHILEFRQSRSKIGYVPQELYVDMYESVWNTVHYSRELFGKAPDNDYLKEIINRLSLWDKRNESVKNLSGGMKRRLLIAKALSHQPEILFLDEPTAGVDVDLRKSMWEQVNDLRNLGVTIFLTTHYIEEAEKMAGRIAVINNGKILLTENTQELVKKMSDKEFIFELKTPLQQIPDALRSYGKSITLSKDSISLKMADLPSGLDIFTFLHTLEENAIVPSDLNVKKRNLEDIFVNLLEKK